MRYMLTRGKIVSNTNNAVPRFLCVKKVDKFLKFFLFIKGMPAAKNKPNVVDKFFVLEGDDNLDFKSFCLYSGGMQIVIFALLFLFSPIGLNKFISADSLIVIISGIFFGLSLIFLVKAMDIEEISRVEPIYLIHTILVPLIGLFYLNENITFDKYIGIVLIFISSIFASVRWEKIKNLGGECEVIKTVNQIK